MQLRTRLCVQTVTYDAPLTLRLPVNSYLFTFETAVTLIEAREGVRPFGRLVLPCGIRPISANTPTQVRPPHDRKTSIGWLPKSALCDLFVTYPALAPYCIEQLTRQMQRLSEQVGHALHRSALPRIAQLLLDLWSISDKRFIFWSHAELAIVLNMHRESLTVLLNELQRRSLVQLHNRRIAVCDVAGLRRLAQDC